MKRIFLIVGHRVRTDGKFNLNDLCGSTGRLDILLRVINSVFLLSNGLRKDAELFLVLKGPPDPPVTIHLIGSELKYLNPDERSTGALIRQALMTQRKPGQEIRSTPGIYVSDLDYRDVLVRLSSDRKPVYLHEKGTPIQTTPIPDPGNVFFVLGDQFDLNDDEEVMLQDPIFISLGPNILHTDHCVVLIQNEMDRRYENENAMDSPE